MFIFYNHFLYIFYFILLGVHYNITLTMYTNSYMHIILYYIIDGYTRTVKRIIQITYSRTHNNQKRMRIMCDVYFNIY